MYDKYRLRTAHIEAQKFSEDGKEVVDPNLPGNRKFYVPNCIFDRLFELVEVVDETSFPEDDEKKAHLVEHLVGYEVSHDSVSQDTGPEDPKDDENVDRDYPVGSEEDMIKPYIEGWC